MNMALRVFYILVFLFFSIYSIYPIKAEMFNSMEYLLKIIRLLCDAFFITYIIRLIINKIKGKPVNVNRHTGWLIAFLVCATVSCFYNKEYDLSFNLKWVKWYALFFSIFLTINNKVALKDNINTFLIVSDVIIIIGIVGCLWSLWQFITSFSGNVILYDYPILTGVVESRLYGIYGNPNLLTVFAFVSLFLSSIQFHFRKNKIAKVCYVVSAIFQYFCLLLSGSRTSLYSFMVVVGLISALYCNRIVIKNKFYKVVGLIVAGVLSAFVFYEACNIIKKGLFYLPYFYQKIVCYSKGDSATKQELTPQNPIERPAFSLSSREIIWREYLEIWKTSPWFGIGPQNSMAVAKERLNDDALIIRQSFPPHNDFLFILVSFGLLGIVPFVVWFGLTCFDILKFLYKNRYKDSPFHFLLRMMSCIVVYFLVTGLAENLIFRLEGWKYEFAYIFFFVSGNVIYLCNQDDESLLD